MYFSALKRLIASVEEKRFYDVSLMFLGVQGYKELSIVDGAGDGGRDVVSSRSDLRIQLSVRKDWENKINQEAAIAFNSGKRHFIYITNRTISPDAEADFRANNFKFPGQVEVTICDLNLVSTTLAQSGVISEAYRMLGISLNISLSPTPKEIALSSVLLFGNEAKELREGVCDANVCATLFDQSIGVAEGDLIAQVVDTLPGVNLGRAIKASISRLRTSGDIIGPPSGMKLGAKKTVQLEAARTDFAKSLADDVTRLKVLTNLSTANARLLLAKARDVLVRGRNIDDNGYLQEEVRSFIASHGLTKKKREIYETLSAANTIRQFQFGETIDRICCSRNLAPNP